MSLTWSTVGENLGNLTSALSTLGVSASSMPSILQAIGAASNPNESAELALCAQILTAAGNPTLVSALAVKLATEQGIPADAAALAMTLANPGVNIPAVVIEIETLIRQGG